MPMSNHAQHHRRETVEFLCVGLRTANKKKCLLPGALVYITGFMAWAGCVTPLCVRAGAWPVTLRGKPDLSMLDLHGHFGSRLQTGSREETGSLLSHPPIPNF